MGLQLGTIAGVWGSGQENAPGECVGDLLETRTGGGGPPTWMWRDEVRPSRISGASYEVCPAQPIDSVVGPLMAALCMGIKWGVTRAFPGTRKRKRMGDSKGLPGITKKSKMPERKWAWPDVVVVGKTNFSDDGRGDLVYRDGIGNVLNLTALYGNG